MRIEGKSIRAELNEVIKLLEQVDFNQKGSGTRSPAYIARLAKTLKNSTVDILKRQQKEAAKIAYLEKEKQRKLAKDLKRYKRLAKKD